MALVLVRHIMRPLLSVSALVSNIPLFHMSGFFHLSFAQPRSVLATAGDANFMVDFLAGGVSGAISKTLAIYKLLAKVPLSSA
jgi:hypothetical protein